MVSIKQLAEIKKKCRLLPKTVPMLKLLPRILPPK